MSESNVFRMNAAVDGIQTKGPLGEAEWDEVFGIVKERGLTKLTGSGEMSNAVMLKLSRLTGLKEIGLDGVQMQDEGLLHLGKIAGLEVLDLSGPKSTLTDAGLAVLRDLKKLKVFKACWPQKFTDAGTVNLAGCADLEEVNLMGTHTGDATLSVLAGKGRLRKLTTGRKVTDAGVPLLHGIPAFRTWQGGEHESPGLMSFMEGPTQLILDGPVTDEGLKGLAGLDGLYGMGFFWHAKAFTSGGLEPVTQMRNLRFFACDGSKVDDAAMEVISRMPRLIMLQGQGAVASDAGFEALSRSRTLEYFWGRECPNLTGTGFEALCRLPALRGLGVSCAKVDLRSLGGLAGVKGLRDLMPMDVPDAGFEVVGRCLGLENLWCMYCRETTDAATEHLSGLKRLKYYYAGRTLITDKSLILLSKMETLEKIELWQTVGVTDVGVRALAGLPRLKKVSMSGLTGVSREVLKVFGDRVEVEV